MLIINQKPQEGRLGLQKQGHHYPFISKILPICNCWKIVYFRCCELSQTLWRSRKTCLHFRWLHEPLLWPKHSHLSSQQHLWWIWTLCHQRHQNRRRDLLQLLPIWLRVRWSLLRLRMWRFKMLQIHPRFQKFKFGWPSWTVARNLSDGGIDLATRQSQNSPH